MPAGFRYLPESDRADFAKRMLDQQLQNDNLQLRKREQQLMEGNVELKRRRCDTVLRLAELQDNARRPRREIG